MGSIRGFLSNIKKLWQQPRQTLQNAGNWLILQRQKHLNRIFSALYGQPMQMVPAGHVGLATTAVFWCLHSGQRQVVMLRSPLAADPRLRFVSSMGLGQQGDAASQLRSAIEQQLGKTFARSVQLAKHITTNRVVAAPSYTYANPELGILTPMQVLVWQVHIQPLQLELIQTPKGLEMMLVPESLLTGNAEQTTDKSPQISPTHRNVWQLVKARLPKMPKVGTKIRPDGVEEVTPTEAEKVAKKLPTRTLH